MDLSKFPSIPYIDDNEEDKVVGLIVLELELKPTKSKEAQDSKTKPPKVHTKPQIPSHKAEGITGTRAVRIRNPGSLN